MLVLVVIILSIVFIIFPKGDEPGIEGKNLWHKQCEKFYQSAAEKIVGIAKGKGVRVIKLMAEENNSDYVCSSPCNEGLANFLKKLLKSNPVVSEIIYLKQPIFDNEFSHWLSAIRSRWVSEECREQLINGKWEMTPMAKGVEPENYLDVRIKIQEIKLDKGNNSYRVTFALVTDKEVVFSNEYNGDATQIRWFLKQNYPLWSVIIVSVFCIVWFFLYLFLPHFKGPGGGEMPAEAQLAAGFIFIGLLSCFILLFCNPLRREVAQYSISDNIIFFIDRNSEIFFTQPNKNVEKVSHPYVVRRICENIMQSLDEPKPSEQKSFFSWICNHALSSIYTRKSYVLSRDKQYPVFAFSGLQEEGHFIPTKLVPATSIDGTMREARLFIPQLVISQLISEGHLDARSKNFACLFTSACATCKEDVQKYLSYITTMSQKKDSSALSVFTAFLPTIPRTGANHHYDYEDCKLALASLISDKVIILNDVSYNVQETLKSIVHELAEGQQINYEQIRSPQKTEKLYKIRNLGFSDDHSEWDKPLDLMEIRSSKFLLGKEEAENGCKYVANEFLNFFKEKKIKDKGDYDIHVLQNEPLSIWFMLILCSMGGYFLFAQTKNDVYFSNFDDTRLVNGFDYIELLLSLILFLLGFFFVQWRCDNPLVWASLGYSDMAFIGGFLAWVCFFCGPFLVFRVWHSGIQLNKAKIWGFVACMLGTGSICVFYLYQDGLIDKKLYLLTFPITVGLACLPLLICLKKGDNPSQGKPGHFSWWRHPWWMLAIKSAFLFCLVIVICGVFHADVLYSFSYSRLVLLSLPILLCLQGLALLASQRPWIPTTISIVTLISMIYFLTLIGG